MKEKTNYEQPYSERDRAAKMFKIKHEDSLPFTPFFIYEIEKKTHPFHLVFNELPSRIRYQNDIYNLLSNFSSIEETIECLEYHYNKFEKKEEFLRNFKFSIPYRIKIGSHDFSGD